MTETNTDPVRRAAESLSEPLRSHALAALAADLHPPHLSRDGIYLTEDAEHIEVTEIMYDAEGWFPRHDDDGVLVTEMHVIPITPEHPWWHDFESPLPRIVNP